MDPELDLLEARDKWLSNLGVHEGDVMDDMNGEYILVQSESGDRLDGYVQDLKRRYLPPELQTYTQRV